MKKILKLIVMIALLFIPSLDTKAAEDLAEELLDLKQKDEIVLNTKDDTLLIKPVETIEQPKTQNPKRNLSNLFDFDGDLDDDGIMDNAELDFEVFKMFDKEKEISEDSLFGKIYHSKISRTDIPSFLLKDDLTFEYEKGPLSKIQLYGGYRGSINSLWNNRETGTVDYSTEYDNLTTEIGVYGSFKNSNFKFKISTNPIPQKGLNYLDRFFGDAYVVNTSIPNHQIIAGFSRVQTGIEGGTSTFVLPFIARSQIARNFGNSRSLGVKLVGNYQYIDYSIAAGSSGRYITSGMPGAEFTGWINVKPFGHKSKKYGKLTIGGGFNGGHNQIDYGVGSVYVGYNHKKLWTNFEAAIADGYNGSKGVSANKACGYAATIGWKLNPHLQLIGRVDQFDPNRETSNDLKREYTIGINWFIKGQALKVILNYVFCDSQNMPDSHKIILGTQIVI